MKTSMPCKTCGDSLCPCPCLCQTGVKVLLDITVSHVAWLSHEDLSAVQDLLWFIVCLSVYVSDWHDGAVGHHCVTRGLIESWRPQRRARLAVVILLPETHQHQKRLPSGCSTLSSSLTLAADLCINDVWKLWHDDDDDDHYDDDNDNDVM